MKIVPALLALSWWLPLAPAPAIADEHVAHWQRYPLLGVPRVETAPTIDGVVDPREWSGAARIGYLLDEKTGVAGKDPSTVLVAHSPAHLHVAFQIERPEHARLPSADDTFEVHLDLAHAHTNTLAVVGNFEKLVSAAPGWGTVEYKARVTDHGWEGEIAVPLAHKSGEVLGANFIRREKTPADRAFAWSYTGRFPPGVRNFGHLVLTGAPLAVGIDPAGWIFRNRDAGLVFTAANFSKEDASLKLTAQVRRAGAGREMAYFPTVDDATTDDLGRPRGSVTDEAAKAMAAYGELTNHVANVVVPGNGRRLVRVAVADEPGDYLATFLVQRGDTTLAAGVVPFTVPAPLGVNVRGHLLLSKALDYEIDLQRLKERVTPTTVLGVVCREETGSEVARAEFDSLATKEKVHDVFRFEPVLGGNYTVTASLRDGTNVIAHNKAFIAAPPTEAIPDWWTMKEGFEPLIPPPWTPVKAGRREVRILGRTYTFDKLALPSQIETRGKKILDGPIELRAAQPWEKSSFRLVEKKPEAAVYESESVAGKVKLKVRSQVEFDGFVYVELELAANGTPHPALSRKGRGEKRGSATNSASTVTSPLAGEDKGEGESATLNKLDLVIPLKKEHAVLMQNYCKTGGPGTFTLGGGAESHANPYKRGKRFVGLVPEEPLFTPPMLTTWIGTDHYGLEFSADNSRGWALADPNKAMEISREGDRVLLTLHLISKPVTLSGEPRRIRFGLCATPTKTLLPYLQRARFHDDYFPFLLPGKWGDFPVWHPPVKNPEAIKKSRHWIRENHDVGRKVLINGGWNISAQDPAWNVWGRELISEPIQNVSFGEAKQFAACYRTPYATFLANSFGYNARLLGFDGIRFDTVIPNYECNSLVHDCGWRDDDGNLWPSYSVFAAREAWKRLYRIFHGGVTTNGCIQTPNAAGPLMAVHSFSDHHEIGEGYYMHAKTLKDGMPPDMIRANMTGEQYGFRAEVSIKGGPMYWNEKNAAILVNGAEPRFQDYRHWKVGYEPQANPAPSIWDAWDWVDRWNARWLGHWENKDFVTLNAQRSTLNEPMILASFHWNEKLKRVLLVVANYEVEPFDDVEVKLDLKKLGLKGNVYAEDAVTLEPIAIAADGAMKLDVLKERYRLVKISHEPPRFRDEVLGDNLLANAPALLTSNWHSAEISLEPNSIYVLTALLKIDKPLGEGSETPNVMGMFSPAIRHLTSLHLSGAGVHGIAGTNMLTQVTVEGKEGLFRYADTPNYQRSYYPQHWEKTPGWMPLFLPVATGTNATNGKVVVSVSGAGQAQIRDILLRKVTR